MHGSLTGGEQGSAQPLFEQLRRGRRPAGRTAEDVIANQRERLCGALALVVAQDGYEAANIKRVSALAGVSRRTFYDRFGTLDACLLAVHFGQAVARFSAAADGGRGDRASLSDAFQGLIDELTAQRWPIRVAFRNALLADPNAMVRMRHTRAALEQALRGTFPAEARGQPRWAALARRGLVCGVDRVMRRCLTRDDAGAVAPTGEELADWALSYDCSDVAQLPAARLGGPPARRAFRARTARARVLRATALIAAKNGPSRLTPRLIATAANVPCATVESLYENTEECFFAAVRRRGLEALIWTADAARDAEDRVPSVHRGVAGLMVAIAGDPSLVRLALVDQEKLPGGAVHRDELIDSFTSLMTERLPPTVPRPSAVLTDAIGGAVAGIVAHHVLHGDAQTLPERSAHLSYLSLAPLIGSPQAVRKIRDASRDRAR